MNLECELSIDYVLIWATLSYLYQANMTDTSRQKPEHRDKWSYCLTADKRGFFSIDVVADRAQVFSPAVDYSSEKSAHQQGYHELLSAPSSGDFGVRDKRFGHVVLCLLTRKFQRDGQRTVHI